MGEGVGEFKCTPETHDYIWRRERERPREKLRDKHFSGIGSCKVSNSVLF